MGATIVGFAPGDPLLRCCDKRFARIGIGGASRAFARSLCYVAGGYLNDQAPFRIANAAAGTRKQASGVAKLPIGSWTSLARASLRLAQRARSSWYSPITAFFARLCTSGDHSLGFHASQGLGPASSEPLLVLMHAAWVCGGPLRQSRPASVKGPAPPAGCQTSGLGMICSAWSSWPGHRNCAHPGRSCDCLVLVASLLASPADHHPGDTPEPCAARCSACRTI